MRNDKIIIPGAAGLVGQNLILMLKELGCNNIIALDKHKKNVEILKELHPDISVVEADVSEPGRWQDSFENGAAVVILQAQITAKDPLLFKKNNVQSTRCVLGAAKMYGVPYIVHISSSVVISVADDDYTKTKKEQERLVVESGIDYCVLRPPLMFGWFDRKHLGWLARFMERCPIYPIPGSGKYLRQPLYVRDLCRVITRCLKMKPTGKIYDIIGRENIDYIDIIRTIKRIKKLKTLIIRIPYAGFYILLKLYALFYNNPPFTTDQLKALTAGDVFPVTDWWQEFGLKPKTFEEAMIETHHDPKYSKYILEL